MNYILVFLTEIESLKEGANLVDLSKVHWIKCSLNHNQTKIRKSQFSFVFTIEQINIEIVIKVKNLTRTLFWEIDGVEKKSHGFEIKNAVNP